MLAIDLIRFLLPPPRGKIHALNSPFDQEVFTLKQKEFWLRRDKATVEEGVLIFNSDFRNSVLRQYHATEMERAADASFERMVDLEASRGRTVEPSFVRWSGRNSGTARTPGGPESRTMQMSKRSWPPGTFKLDEPAEGGGGDV